MAALSVFRSQSFLPELFPAQKRISAQAGLRAIRRWNKWECHPELVEGTPFNK